MKEKLEAERRTLRKVGNGGYGMHSGTHVMKKR